MADKQRAGREELAARVQKALGLSTKKEAEHVVNTVIASIEETLIENLATNGFSLKLNSLAKLIVRHKKGIYRKIPFTGDTRLTKDKRKIKFIILGKLRQKEIAD